MVRAIDTDVLSLDTITADWMDLRATRSDSVVKDTIRLTLSHLIFRFRQVWQL